MAMSSMLHTEVPELRGEAEVSVSTWLANRQTCSCTLRRAWTLRPSSCKNMLPTDHNTYRPHPKQLTHLPPHRRQSHLFDPLGLIGYNFHPSSRPNPPPPTCLFSRRAPRRLRQRLFSYPFQPLVTWGSLRTMYDRRCIFGLRAHSRERLVLIRHQLINKDFYHTSQGHYPSIGKLLGGICLRDKADGYL